jgi:hypothetical protein
MRFRMLALLALAAAFLLPRTAMAGSISFDLTVDEHGGTAPPADSALVTVDLTSPTTATVTFAGENVGGNQYYMTEAFINVSGTSSIASVTGTTYTGATAAFTTATNQSLDSYGQASYEIRDTNTHDNDSQIVITLDATGGNTWASASNVLTPTTGYNPAYYSQGFDAYVAAGDSGTTGYAGNDTEDLAGYLAPAPEPPSLLLLGTGLLGLAFVAFRKAKASGLTLGI